MLGALEFQLAYRNLVGAKLRTWLNVGVLSFIYVLVIWHQGLFDGLSMQIKRDTINDEVGGGQYWVEGYDSLDPLTLKDSHDSIPEGIQKLARDGKAVPILIRQASIYPEGRMQSVMIKGINPAQQVLNIPTSELQNSNADLPILIGKIMARKNKLNIGDLVTIRWRDSKGTFDAVEGEISVIMNSIVPAIDNGQLWVPLEKLQKMSGLKNEATIVTIDPDIKQPAEFSGWIFRGHDFLLKDVNDMITSKKVGGSIMYIILMLLAMLAIFDTQILSIWRRKKEIGTHMALGMTRSRVIGMFTLEGAMNGILAIAVAAVYGIPFLFYQAKYGMSLAGFYSQETLDEFGFAMALRMFPVYSVGLVTVTIMIIMFTVTIVSYLPSRKISKLKPTEALKGKMS